MGVYLGEGSSSPVALDGSSDERNLPHRKRSFVQMLMMENLRDGLDPAELDEMGAVYVMLLSTTCLFFFFHFFHLCPVVPLNFAIVYSNYSAQLVDYILPKSI